MPTEDNPEETTVNDRGTVRIPASIRRRLDVGSGDRLRWSVDDAGRLSVDVVRRSDGAFDGLESVPMSGDGLETHDLAGHEVDTGEDA